MKDEDIFIELDNNSLLDPLSKEEMRELFKTSKLDEKSRNKIIEHNIKLVLHEVLTRFHDFNYDKKELVSIGILGLVKAVDTYDSLKGYEFTTYATRCIDNEILMFIRKRNIESNIISFEEVICKDNNDNSDNNIKIESLLRDKTDFREEMEKKEVLTYLRNLIDKLDERNKKIIMLYFGFYNDKCYTSNEIASIFNLSHTRICVIINKIINNFGIELEKQGLIELFPKKYVRMKKK